MLPPIAVLLLAALPMNEVDPDVWTTSGSLIPNIELPKVDGSGTVHLADFRGRKLLLIQFASW